MKTYYAEYEAERRLANDGHYQFVARDDQEAMTKARAACPSGAVLMYVYTDSTEGFRSVFDK